MRVAAMFVASALALLAQDGAREPSSAAAPEPIEPETLALFAYDREADLEIEEHGYEPFQGYSITDLSYASPAGGRVPALLYQPEGDGPFAAIVMMHGMPGSRESSRQLAPEYMRAGAVVLAISAPWARPDGPRDNIVSFTKKDRDEQVQLIQDLQRAVDFLESLDLVDPERMAYHGGSYGGAMGGLLAGIERRLLAYVLVVGDGGLVAHFSSGDDDGGGRPKELPREAWEAWLAWMEPIEPIRFVAHAAPAQLLFQNGKTDRMVPAADARAYQEAASEPKTILWYEDGHAFTPERIDDHLDWLAERIGIAPARD